MLRHLLPNCLGPVMVFATIQIANAIVLEATLSFLGGRAHHRTLARPAHCQRLSVPAVGRLLDQHVPRPGPRCS